MAWPSLSTPELLFSIPCLLLLIYYYFHYITSSKNKQNTVPVCWPVVGMMPALILNLHNLHTWITDILRVCRCNFFFRGSWKSGMNLFITSDPSNIQHIFTSNFQNYPKGEEFLEIFDILGDGIFNSDSDVWIAQRVKAQHLIAQPLFRAYVAQSSQDKVEKALLPFLANASKRGHVVDLQDVCLRFTFDITTKLVFGIDPNALSMGLPVVPFARAMDDAMETLFFRHVIPIAVWKLLRKLNIGREKKLANASRAIDQFVEQTIEERRAEIKQELKETEKLPDLLSSYMDDNETGKLDKFLRDTTVNLMLAGRDTTGAGLSWFLWLLTQFRHVEGIVLNELNSIPHSSTSDGMVVFNPEDLTKSVYLHAALNEALRLFPPVPFEHKGVLKDDMLPSGFLITPGVKILISTYSMARMEGVWGKDCSEFKPERWISDKNKLKYEPSYKFLSFNTGPRTCLGKDVAFTQMKVAAAALVYNFQFEVVEGHVIAPKHSIILQMKNGLKVKVKKRSTDA